MLKIRLKCIGRKNYICYKVILTDSKKRRDGKFYDILGYYNPIKNVAHINILKFNKYINKGAIPTNSIRHLIFKILKK